MPRHVRRTADFSRTDTLLGLAASLGMGWVAVRAGSALPVVGAPVVALALGFTAAHIPKASQHAAPGMRVGGHVLLQAAVVLLGSQISFGAAAQVGMSAFPVMVVTLTAGLVAAAGVGRAMRIDSDLRTLIGVGTGICGASAIAAVSSVIRPRSSAVAYALSTIFLFNVAAVLTFPALGHLLHMSQSSFGVFAGTAVNDVSSVVAAATAYGHAAATQATVVKLTRTLMIVPISIFLSTRRRDGAAIRTVSMIRLVPRFLVGFVLMTAAQSCGIFPPNVTTLLARISAILTASALVAIGFQTDIAAIRANGLKPIGLGAILWLAVSCTSLLTQAIV